MRILRLTDSNDLRPEIPEQVRGAAIADREFERITGARPETILKPIWPEPGLPAIVARWLERHEPDLVLLRCPTFWVSFESVPLKIERHWGRLGALPARLGYRAGGNAAFASSRVG